jgi:hypothetical protein
MMGPAPVGYAPETQRTFIHAFLSPPTAAHASVPPCPGSHSSRSVQTEMADATPSAIDSEPDLGQLPK